MAVSPQNSVQLGSHESEAQVFDQYIAFAADPEIERVELLAKLLYLLENVAEQDKTALIKSKIIGRRYERFDLARSWNEGDEYFKKFLGTLDVSELQSLLATIKLPFTQHQITNPKTAAAFKFAFYGQATPTPKLIIEETIDSVGNHFTASLEESAARAYREANIKYPARNLEKRELSKCGKPCGEIFNTYLNMLGDDQTRRKFNKFIRDRITNEALSDYQLQERLLYAADRLADVLEQQHKSIAAENIRSSLIQAGYPSKPLNAKKQIQRAPLIQFFVNSAKRLMHDTRKLLQSRPSKKIVPAGQDAQYKPVVAYDGSHPNDDALKKLQELYARFAKVQQEIHKNGIAENNGAAPAKDLMFSYRPADAGFDNNPSTEKLDLPLAAAKPRI